MNAFLDPESGRGEPPANILARVDSLEVADEAGEDVLVLAAGVDEGWAREMLGDSLRPDDLPPSLIERMDDAPLVITEFWLPRRNEDPHFLREFVRPGAWLKISAGGNIEAAQYASLFGAPTVLSVSIEQVRKDYARQLDAAFSIGIVPEATQAQIEHELNDAGEVDFVVVLDVGQGNACSLWRANNVARMYFDVGGGIVANTRTFPRNRVPFCTTRRPLIVLSHWDWDHWSSAMRYQEFLKSNWLAPRQQLDPVHLAFAWQLHQRGRLRQWPRGLREAKGGSIRLELCNGHDPKDKNNSGLAMTVEGTRNDGSSYRMLIPGDAHFDSIPSVTRREKFDAVVASHHGSLVDAIHHVTAPAADAALVYSVGHGNSFGHPRLHAELAYLQANWLPDRTFATTQTRRNRPCDIGVPLSDSAWRTGCTACMPKVWTR